VVSTPISGAGQGVTVTSSGNVAVIGSRQVAAAQAAAQQLGFYTPGFGRHLQNCGEWRSPKRFLGFTRSVVYALEWGRRPAAGRDWE